MKGRAKETTTAAVADDGRRTKRTRRREPVERETQGDAAHERPMTMIDPWSMLLEQLLEEPTDDDGGENRPAARAQPEAGAVVKPKRPKKGERRQ
jgi:hypothetical protein